MSGANGWSLTIQFRGRVEGVLGRMAEDEVGEGGFAHFGGEVKRGADIETMRDTGGGRRQLVEGGECDR